MTNFRNWRNWDLEDWVGHGFMVLVIPLVFMVLIAIWVALAQRIFEEKPEWGTPYHQCLEKGTTTTFVKSGNVMVPVTSHPCLKYSKEFYVESKNGIYLLKLIDGKGDK